MCIDFLRARSLAVPFKTAFRHASAERSAMESVWVEAEGGGLVGLGEGCPRDYVTGESIASALGFIEEHRARVVASVVDFESLAAYVEAHRADIDANPAAWCAIELAVLDLIAKRAGRSVEGLMELPEAAGTFRYSAVLGDGSLDGFVTQLGYYLNAGFEAFKIKLSGDRARDGAKVAALEAAGVEPCSVRADANNLFPSPDAAIAHLTALGYRFFAIEEPLEAGKYAGMRRIGRAREARIIVDESLLREEQVAPLAKDAGAWIANLRVSKMGGLIRSIAVARAAMKAGIPIIVGAHVGETSVLTRAGLTVAAFAREHLIAQEGAFGTHLLERDMVDPPLMFGRGGYLSRSG
jgi:L-alanine-DL-glutamate epimerase-like enolase superfamily enzyme